MKFGFDWPSGFGEELLKCLATEDGRRTDAGSCSPSEPAAQVS